MVVYRVWLGLVLVPGVVVYRAWPGLALVPGVVALGRWVVRFVLVLVVPLEAFPLVPVGLVA